MFEKIGQSAERVVGKVSVSRRGFLGRAAKAAAVLGAAVAGLAASRAEAWPNRPRCGCRVNQTLGCFYENGDFRPATKNCKCPNIEGTTLEYTMCVGPW
jgi:hypothetical protein